MHASLATNPTGSRLARHSLLKKIILEERIFLLSYEIFPTNRGVGGASTSGHSVKSRG